MDKDIRVLHGDRIEAMNMLEEKSVDLIFTSPPYNLNIDYTDRDDNQEFEDYLNFLNETWIATKRILKDDGRIIINIPAVAVMNKKKHFLHIDITNQLRKLGFKNRGTIIWNKQHIANRNAWGSWKSPSNPNILYPFEYILVFDNNSAKHSGNRENITIDKETFIESTNALWNITPETRKSNLHPAPFPETLSDRIIEFYSFKGDVILDMFSGSGTTCISAITLDRKCIYIDNSREYIDMFLDRLKKYIIVI